MSRERRAPGFWPLAIVFALFVLRFSELEIPILLNLNPAVAPGERMAREQALHTKE